MTYVPAATRALTFADTPFTVPAALLAVQRMYTVDASGGATTVNLPDPTTVPGMVVQVAKIDGTANAVTIATPAGTVGVGGGASCVIVVPGTCLHLKSTGVNWIFV